MKLGETITYCSLERVFLCGSVPIQSVPCDFNGRAGSDVSTSHILPHTVLAAITLVGVGAGDGGAKARPKCELWLLFCSVANSTLLGERVGPKLLQKKP